MAVEDVRHIFDRAVRMGIKIAGPSGAGRPQLSGEMIAFNGLSACGHRYRDLGRPFASDTAAGVEEIDPPYDSTKEPWMSGPFLETRVCGGDCSADPFVFDRKYLVRDWERQETPGFYACSCETHFKPIDLVVTAVLVRIKERLGDSLIISSENPARGFDDAIRFCRELFGHTTRFEVNAPQAEILT